MRRPVLLRPLLRPVWAALLLTPFAAAPGAAQPAPFDPSSPPRGLMPRQQNAMPGPLAGEAPGADLPGADPFQLLVNSFEVQRDLGLTRSQLANLQLAGRNFRTQMQELAAPRPGTPPEHARAAMAQHMAGTRAMIARELTPEQLARLQQILLQIEGPCLAVADRPLGQQLGLAGEQERQVAATCRSRLEQIRAAFRPPGPGLDPCQAAAGNRERIERIRARTDEQVLSLFSPQQRAHFTAMQGRRIPLEPPMPPGCS